VIGALVVALPCGMLAVFAVRSQRRDDARRRAEPRVPSYVRRVRRPRLFDWSRECPELTP
jgi:hypothetical protein